MSDVVGRINFGPLSSDPLPVSELDKHHIKLAQCWCDSQTQIADLTKRLAAADKAKDATYLQMVARIADLTKRLAAAEEDAARYRHVRKKPHMLLHLKNSEFDAAIDAARRETSDD